MGSGGESDGDEAVGKGGVGGEQLTAAAPGAVTEDKVYVPGQPLDEGEELVHDSSAYHMYHAVSSAGIATLRLLL